LGEADPANQVLTCSLPKPDFGGNIRHGEDGANGHCLKLRH
jgi:hypothetical protein